MAAHRIQGETPAAEPENKMLRLNLFLALLKDRQSWQSLYLADSKRSAATLSSHHPHPNHPTQQSLQ